LKDQEKGEQLKEMGSSNNNNYNNNKCLKNKE
jgi:hypothetical protein